MLPTNDFKYPNSEILVFAKAPVAGKVKTRLIPDIGPEKANSLYQLMLEQTINTAVSSGLCRVTLVCTPDSSHPFFQYLANRYHIGLAAQQGADLGERMFNAASCSLRNAKNVILIGSDCLQMTATQLEEALCNLLQDENEIVITPAQDGGYVLLGLRRIDRDLFKGVEWGSSRVMNQTRNALQQLNWKWQQMAPLKDLDTIEDIYDIVTNEHQYHLETGVRELIRSLTSETQE